MIEVTRRLIPDRDLVLALLLHVFVDVDAAIDKVLLRKHGLEYLLAIVHVNTVQVLCLGFLFSDDVDTVEHA